MGYILITGGNLKNKGAQSMIFITVDEMKKRFPDKEILVISDPDAAASEALTESFRFSFRDSVCLYGKKYKLVQHRYGKLDRMGDAARISRNVDMIVDISGYTFGSNWGWMANLLAAYRARRARKYGAPIYFMPQSFGPFEWKGIMGKLTDRFLAAWLPYAKVLYAREQEGYDLLTNGYGFRNVRLSEDLVLQNRGINLEHIYKEIPEMKLPEVKTGSVAVLPNIRNTKYGDLQSLLTAYRTIIDLQLSVGRTVYLVRHATEDLTLCRKIKELYEKEPAVVLLEQDFTCLEYEALVTKFDYLVASRYHAIVHAYKQGVPCIVLGWAIKYQELLNKFYQQDYAVDVRVRISPEALSEKVRRMEARYAAESEVILKQLREIQRKNAFDIFESAKQGAETISATVDENLCTSCGICAAVCPVSCIRFEKARGTYLPRINHNRCIHCGKCLRVCPGYAYSYEPEPKSEPGDSKSNSESSSGSNSGSDKLRRPLCLSARTKDGEVLRNATSGGFVTALVRKLLNNGSYTTAFLASGYQYEEQMMTQAVHQGESLSLTQRSRYLPVSQTKAVSYILEHPQENIIYVGTGCAVHGLLRALHESGRGREHVLVIGLFCDRSMNYSVYEYVKRMRPWNSKLTGFYFRDKRAGGWPGNMRLEFEDGSYRHIPAKERMIVKDFCQMQRCLYCYDKLNAQADISVGDNYTGRNAPKEGSNSLVIRTSLGLQVWEECQAEFLYASAEFSEIAKSQHMEEKKRQIRNNRIYAAQHGGRSVEQGLPGDLEPVSDLTVPVRKRDIRELKRKIAEIRLGELEKFDVIQRKKERKRLNLYWKAICSRLGF